MHVALTGVSGFIGSILARELHLAGHTVTGLVRPTSRRDHIEPWVERFVVGDQDDESCWSNLLDQADCVVHNSVDFEVFKSTEPAAFERNLQSNLVGSLKLLHASGPRPFVFMSTIAVHHDMRPRWNGRIDEDHPLRPGTLYGAYKAAVEAHLWAAHFGQERFVTAIRPCGVYGLDPKLSRSIGYPIIQRIREGRPFRRAGGGKFVHVDDVAATVVACLGNDAANGRAFNLVDCYARWSDWARMTAELLGVDADIDDSSPASPKNEFLKDGVESLGVTLDRGPAGIREHLAGLIEAMDA